MDRKRRKRKIGLKSTFFGEFKNELEISFYFTFWSFYIELLSFLNEF
jgi:hypothetical protein